MNLSRPLYILTDVFSHTKQDKVTKNLYEAKMHLFMTTYETF